MTDLSAIGGALRRFLINWFAGHTIFAFNPATKVDELASFRTKGAIGIIFPRDGSAAGWTLHENSGQPPQTREAGRLIRIRRFTNSIVPSRRMAFKRTVTLSRVEPTIDAISR